MSYKFPLAIDSWDTEEKKAIYEVVQTGKLTMGKKVEQFEKKFAEYNQSKYAIMVNSGSSANLLMIASLFYSKYQSKKLKKGDEVIVPAVSWSTSYFPLYQYGLKIRFVDIDLQTLNYNLEKLENAITNKTRVILAVNLLGNPNDFGKIDQFISNRNIILLEDNCEALGAEFQNKKTGSIGLLGSSSFYFSHHISTMEGGMIVTNDEELFHIILCLRAHGWTRNLPAKNQVENKIKNGSFEESFNFILPGYNLRPLEICGAIGVKQLEKFPDFLQHRRNNAEIFKESMKDVDEIITQTEIGKSSWFGFSMIINPESKLKRSDLVTKLEKRGFECRPIVAGDFTKNKVVKYFEKDIPSSLEIAQVIDKNGLFIGNHHINMSETFIELKKVFAKK